MNVCMHVCLRVCVYKYIHTYIYIHIYVRLAFVRCETCTCMRTYTHTCTVIHACMQEPDLFTALPQATHSHVHVHMHTHTCIHPCKYLTLSRAIHVHKCLVTCHSKVPKTCHVTFIHTHMHIHACNLTCMQTYTYLHTYMHACTKIQL